jgi:hypothetical protein
VRSRITATVIGAAILIGGYAAVQGGGGEGASANAFVVATGGTPNCTRSSTLITYQQAVDAGGGAICGPGNGNVGFNATPFDNACDAANAGDIVAVRNGNYIPDTSNGSIMQAGEDCAPGAGDYNPNWEEQGVSEGSTSNWTTFIPAESPQAITFRQNRIYLFAGNYHMIWKDIDINTGFQTNYGGESSASQRVQNVIIRGNSATDRANIHGIQVIGSKNILFKYLDYGPSTQCGKVDVNVPDTFECSASAPAFESQYSNYGSASAGCGPGAPNPLGGSSSLCGGYFDGGGDWVELYIHDISGAIPYLNVRLEDVINHDQQGKLDGGDVHPGCLMTWDSGNNSSAPAHNLVLDHYVCVRATGAAVQFGDSGATIQNSVFGCQVQSLQNTGGVWDGSCTNVPFGLAQKNSANNLTNVLIRYNTFIGTSNGGGGVQPLLIQNSGAFDPDITNVRIVGNLFMGSPTCGISGVTYSTNTYTSGSTSCESDGTATVLGVGDPIVDSSYDTADGLYVLDGDPFDPTADGSPALTALNPTSRNTACSCTDYTLGWDFQREARSSTSTKPGADG